MIPYNAALKQHYKKKVDKRNIHPQRTTRLWNYL